MPRAASLTRPVQVRFHPDDVKAITAVAETEGWTWRPSTTADPLPSVSDAVRRLVLEALDTRTRADTVTIPPAVLAWIDKEAARTDSTREDTVVALLREAATARSAKRP
jgi:hypothetical protein